MAAETNALPPPLPTDDEIIAACHPTKRWLVYPSREAPIAFVKYGAESTGVMAEMRNQAFALKNLERMSQQDTMGIRIPRIFRVIERDKVVFIVMEYIHGKTLEELLSHATSDQNLHVCFNRITRAIKLFLSFKISPEDGLGPVGGGIIKHPLFKDAVASVQYASVEELQVHMNKVANFLPHNNITVDFAQESLCFCFADLYEGNFIFTDAGMVYIVDFEHTSILPLSFMTYALEQPHPVCTAIKDKFDLPKRNLANMRVAGYYFMMTGRKVGLPLNDDDGGESGSMTTSRTPHAARSQRISRTVPIPPLGMTGRSPMELGNSRQS